VSPSYAMEIHDYRYAYGLDPIVNMQSTKIRGILNGIDTASYNPADDKNIHERYDAGSIGKKSANKLYLQDSLRLPKEKDIPMICIITRLVKHKGIDLLIGAMNELVELPLQFVLLGKGDSDFESRFEYYQDRYPDKIRAVIDFDNRLSRIIYAAADFAIMPSKFEPCGITQMIASRYGTVPIVRETGGLKDSIKPYDGETDSGNGFTFFEYESEKVVEVVKKALEVYNNKDEWSKLTERVINWDFSWQKSAIEYLKMYDELI
jgi:Glycogen synthase